VAFVPVVRKLLRGAEPWLDAPVLIPWLAIFARLLAGGYAAASFAFFVTASKATLHRALVENALGDSEQRRLMVFLAVGMIAAVSWGARALRRGRDAVDVASREAFVAAPLACWPLYEASPSFPVRFVAIAACVGLTIFALHGLATRSPRRSILDRLDGRTIDRAAGPLALVLGVARGCAMGWSSPPLVLVNAVAVGAAAFALYAIARRRTGQPGVSLLLALAYLLHPALPGIAVDAQAILPLSALVLAFVWTMEAERPRAVVAYALFAAAVIARWDAIHALGAYSAFLLVESRHVTIARRLLALSAAVVVAAAALGRVEAGIVNVLHAAAELGSTPDKWALLVTVLFPVAFVPFVAPRSAMIVLPALVACVVTGPASAALLVPVLLVATAMAIARFREPRARTVLAIAVVLSTCLVTAKVAP
jgi:hypothetical protein